MLIRFCRKRINKVSTSPHLLRIGSSASHFTTAKYIHSPSSFSYSISCMTKLSAGQHASHLLLNNAVASTRVILFFFIMYAKMKAGERDKLAKQCMRTAPSDDRVSSMRELTYNMWPRLSDSTQK